MPRSAALTRARLRVAAGILLDPGGRILISDRSRAAAMREYWEFPGGKLASGETAPAALCRELREELGIAPTAFEHFRQLGHDYPDFSVLIDFFLVTAWDGTPDGREGQALRWVLPSALDAALLLPADAPILDALRGRSASSGER